MDDVLVTGLHSASAEVDLAAVRWDRKPPRLSRMDRLSALALVAAEGALRDAGLEALAPGAPEGERVAVVVATAYGCHATNEEYYRGIVREGPPAASPRLFAYTLPSSPLGEVSIHVGARGPAETLSSGRHAGLEALGRARSLLAEGRADLVIVVGVEVSSPSLSALGVRCREGAVAFVVERADEARRRSAPARGAIGGVGSAFDERGPGEGLRAARARALADAGLSLSKVVSVEESEGDGAFDVLAAVAGVVELRGDGRPRLIVASDRGGGAAALVVRKIEAT